MGGGGAGWFTGPQMPGWGKGGAESASGLGPSWTCFQGTAGPDSSWSGGGKGGQLSSHSSGK
eukprot:11146357-Alexandrium_andersonii.AAC.1